MNKKNFSKFTMLIAVIGIFGFTVANVLAIDKPTSTQISNLAPSFTVHTTEYWTQAYAGSVTTSARTESSATYPTNAGTNVGFKATATDDNSDQYYLILCESAGVTPGNNTAPTCTGTQICVSTATNSGVEASCTKDTTGLTNETYDWYSYVCDRNAAGSCSSVSNTSTGGSADEPDNMAGAPYHVNHAPTYTIGTIVDSTDGSIAPGDIVKFLNSADADADTNATQDTINFYVCSGEADQGGVTTAFDFFNDTCTGGTLLCSQATVDPSSANATCNDTQNIVSVPTAHATNYSVKVYVEDGHSFNLGSATVDQDFTVIDVAPVFSSYTTADTVNGTITAGGSDTLTRAVTFTDDNGDNDPTQLDMAFFEATTVTDACTSDDNDCYRVDNVSLSALPSSGCSTTTRSAAGTGKTATGTDSSLTVSCDFIIWFNATASTDWEISATATDQLGDVNFADSNVNSIIAALSGIGVTEASIAYGTVAVGGTSSFQGTNMENLGNQILDVLISGTDMTSGGNTIPNEQQKWDQTTADFDWDTSLSAFALVSSGELSTTPATGCANRDMAVRAAHATGTEDEDVYWKIRIPASQASGSYTGTNTFATTASSTCSGTLY